MNKFILMLLVSGGLAFICGCDGSTSQVKSGVLSQHPDITVGAAFESSFDNTKWETSDDKGRKVVRFTGRIKQETHDKAVKKTNFDQSLIIEKYKSEEFRKRIAPYEEKQKGIDAEIESIRQQLLKRSELYQKLGDEEMKANINFGKAPTKENEKIVNEVKQKKELMLKENGVLENKIDQCKAKLQPLIEEQNLASQKNISELLEDFKNNSYWPVGSVVEFEFTVYPDGKKFEIVKASSDSWLKQQLDLESVLRIIFVR